jgi:hypothetical protein
MYSPNTFGAAGSAKKSSGLAWGQPGFPAQLTRLWWGVAYASRLAARALLSRNAKQSLKFYRL